MAKKTPANQSSSGSQNKRQSPGVSRKVIGKTSAPYERKAAEDEGEEKKRSGQEPGAEPQAAGPEPARDRPSEPAAEPQLAGVEAKGKAQPKTAAVADHGDAAPSRAGSTPDAGADIDAAATAPGPEGDDQPGAGVEARDEKPGRDEPAATAPAREEAVATPPARTEPQSMDAEQIPAPAFDPTAEFAELWPPTFIQQWDADAPAPPPAKAPPGDSRSFRRWHDGAEEFVLIYRFDSFLIKRAGQVGRMGTWKVTEYPYIGAAAHAYAQECSELMNAGYRDLR